MEKLGVERPIYYGLSIRSPQYIKFIRDSEGQGFFSEKYHFAILWRTRKMIETIHAYKETVLQSNNLN